MKGENNNKKIENMLNEIEKHPLLIVFLCMIVPIAVLQFIYWGMIYFNITCFAEPLSESDLLGFIGDIIGSLIGGLIALYVLRITILNERKSQDEERRLLLMPMLLYDISSQKVVLDTEKSEDIFKASFFGTKSIEFDLQIHNIGLGAAVSVALGSWKVGNIEYLTYNEFRAVPKDEKVSIKIKLELPTYDEYNDEIGQDIDFSRLITFKNLLGNQYKQEVVFTFHRLKYYEGDERLETEKIIVKRAKEVEEMKGANE